MIIAFSAMLILAQISPSVYRAWAPWIFIFSFGLLLAVLILGVVGKGAQRWLNLGLLKFQPSELMKLSVPMMLAWYLHDKSLPPSLFDLFIAFMIVTIPTLLVIKQPDLGTALLIVASGVSVILLAGINGRWLLLGSLLMLIVAPLGWHFMHEYQKLRVLTFLNPERDPLGAGYHITQAKIAMGSGGLLGRGYMQGTQSRLNFLPEKHTDFILTTLSEEFGFIGTAALLGLYALIVVFCIASAISNRDRFGALLTGGVAFTFLLAFSINMGMVMGLMPVVGVPLPLVSYGGSAMIVLLAAFGLVQSAHVHRPRSRD